MYIEFSQSRGECLREPLKRFRSIESIWFMKLGKKGDLKFGIDNVLDKIYAEHLNKPNAFDPSLIQVNEPGRSL